MLPVDESRLAVDGEARISKRDFDHEQPVVGREFLAVGNIADEVVAEQERRVVRTPAFAQLLGNEVIAIHPGIPGIILEGAGFVVPIEIAGDDDVRPFLACQEKLLVIRALGQPVVRIEKADILPWATLKASTIAQSLPHLSMRIACTSGCCCSQSQVPSVLPLSTTITSTLAVVVRHDSIALGNDHRRL